MVIVSGVLSGAWSCTTEEPDGEGQAGETGDAGAPGGSSNAAGSGDAIAGASSPAEGGGGGIGGTSGASAGTAGGLQEGGTTGGLGDGGTAGTLHDGGTAGALHDGGAAGALPEGGAGGSSTDSFGCTEDEFPLLGAPTTCVTCGSYHYTAYEPVYYDVCEIYGSDRYYDPVTHKLYIEAKPGFPAPTSWYVRSDTLPGVQNQMYIRVLEESGCFPGPCEPPGEPPACAANPFPIQVSVSGKYLVADVSEAAACAATTETPMYGAFEWRSISYGCAGTVGTFSIVDFPINAGEAPATVTCLAGDGLEPQKVDGPPP